MTERKRARPTWFNVYTKPDGSTSRDRWEHGTRTAAVHRARYVVIFNNYKLLYRIRVRRYLEPKT